MIIAESEKVGPQTVGKVLEDIRENERDKDGLNQPHLRSAQVKQQEELDAQEARVRSVLRVSALAVAAVDTACLVDVNSSEALLLLKLHTVSAATMGGAEILILPLPLHLHLHLPLHLLLTRGQRVTTVTLPVPAALPLPEQGWGRHQRKPLLVKGRRRGG